MNSKNQGSLKQSRKSTVLLTADNVIMLSPGVKTFRFSFGLFWKFAEDFLCQSSLRLFSFPLN